MKEECNFEVADEIGVPMVRRNFAKGNLKISRARESQRRKQQVTMAIEDRFREYSSIKINITSEIDSANTKDLHSHKTRSRPLGEGTKRGHGR